MFILLHGLIALAKIEADNSANFDVRKYSPPHQVRHGSNIALQVAGDLTLGLPVFSSTSSVFDQFNHEFVFDAIPRR